MLELPIKDYLIVGSYALGVRSAKDIDVICYKKDIEVDFITKDDYCGHFMHNGWKIELLFADKQKSLQRFLKFPETSNKTAPDFILYALKAGHITYPHREWDKHIMDYHILHQRIQENYYFGELFVWDREHNYNSTLDQLIRLHKESTKERLGEQRLPKLKGVTKDEFFDDAVNKYYDHDDIHKWFAHRENPMYTYMQPNSNTVDCDKKMWMRFSYEDKIKCVMEECYVIASERHLIPRIKNPNLKPISPEAAFRWALMRVCTTLCSGWFRGFAINSYFDILNNFNKNYHLILKEHICNS